MSVWIVPVVFHGAKSEESGLKSMLFLRAIASSVFVESKGWTSVTERMCAEYLNSMASSMVEKSVVSERCLAMNVISSESWEYKPRTVDRADISLAHLL